MPKTVINDRSQNFSNKERQTKAGHVVVYDSPDGGLPSEGRVASSDEPQERGQTENADVEPVEVLQQVLPGDWGQRLLVLERVGHVVVRNVGVGGDVFRVVDKLCRVDRLVHVWRRRVWWRNRRHEMNVVWSRNGGQGKARAWPGFMCVNSLGLPPLRYIRSAPSPGTDLWRVIQY